MSTLKILRVCQEFVTRLKVGKIFLNSLSSFCYHYKGLAWLFTGCKTFMTITISTLWINWCYTSCKTFYIDLYVLRPVLVLYWKQNLSYITVCLSVHSSVCVVGFEIQLAHISVMNSYKEKLINNCKFKHHHDKMTEHFH